MEQVMSDLSTPRRAGAEFAAPLPAIVCLEADLFFAPRLFDVIQQQGGVAVIVETPDAFVDAVDQHFPVLALLDLASDGDWAHAITRCKMRPHTSQIPIIAFGSHVDAQTLRTARHAGADYAWPRSKLMGELPQTVERYLRPPIVFSEGWDAPLSDLARRGIEELNAGEYFEQHELLEAAWMAEPRPIREMYQGILQVGVAFLQIERNNWAGALKMFRRGLPRLRSLPPVCQGVDIASFRSVAEQIHWTVTALGPARLHEFDQTTFPRIALIE
jgi:DNA-binding NarL/FixJ family response regulator